METFESARIQTAARAVGVAQNALELGLQYAKDRSQFGKQILKFPRIFNKLAWMAMETTVARQITLFSAREKDNDIRCDIEAGMAKLLAARVAWSNADSALQIHGGNGYALEACNSLISYFFSNHSGNKLYASHILKNEKSKKILLNLGFQNVSKGKVFSLSKNKEVEDVNYELVNS